MSEEKNKNKKLLSVDEELTKNMKIKKIVKKKFLKKKENFGTIMFDVVDVKDSNTKIFMKYHINNTMTISSSFTKFSFEFENFLKQESATQAHEK